MKAVGANEAVVPASEYQEAQRQIKELQRLLGKKTLEAEILKEAVEVARAKSGYCALRDRRGAPLGGSSVSNAWDMAKVK